MMQCGRKSFEKVIKNIFLKKLKKNKIKKPSKNPKIPLKIQKKNYKKIKNIIKMKTPQKLQKNS